MTNILKIWWTILEWDTNFHYFVYFLSVMLLNIHFPHNEHITSLAQIVRIHYKSLKRNMNETCIRHECTHSQVLIFGTPNEHYVSQSCNYCSNAKWKNFLHIYTWQFFQWCVAFFIWSSLMYTFLSFNSWHFKRSLHVPKLQWVTTRTFFTQMQNAKASYTSTRENLCNDVLQFPFGVH